MQFSNPGAVIENTIREEQLGLFFNSSGSVDVLIDLGCGMRPYQHIYRLHCKKSIGIDLPDSPFPKENIDIYCTASDIPLEDNTADIVLSTEMMHDIAEPRAMLREVNRILKKNGSLVLTTPFVVPTVDGKYDHYRYTEQGLRYLLTMENFEVMSIYPVSDVFGTTITLMIKPWLRLWNVISKALHFKGFYSIYNPLVFVTAIVPQLLYLWTRKLPLIKSLYKKFSYSAIGFITIAKKK